MDKRRNFPNWVSAATEISDNAPSPPVFRKWAAISAVAGALGRKVWLDLGAFQVRPNLFIVLVAEPAVGKSVALGLPFGKVFKHMANYANIVRNSPEWSHNFEKFGLEEPFRVGADRVTPEKVVVNMATNLKRVDPDLSTFDEDFYDASLTVVVSEFGTFFKMEDTGVYKFMTAMWDCPEEYQHDTKTQNSYMIRGGYLNLIACATPTQFVENMPKNARSQGFLSRIIAVYYGGSPVVQDVITKPYSEMDIRWLRQDLAEIGKMKGEFHFEGGTGGEAYRFVNEWHKSGMLPAPTDPNLTEYLGRRLGHYLKLCMVVSAAKGGSRIITLEDAKEAQALLLEVERDMPEALRGFGQSDSGRTLEDVAKLTLKFKDGMPIKKFYAEVLRRVHSSAEVKAAVESMERSGLIRIEDNKVHHGHV